MASGMELLLQSLGLDPDAIRQTIAAVQTQFEEVNKRLQSMENKLDRALSITVGYAAAANLALESTEVSHGNSQRNTGTGTNSGTGSGTSGGTSK